MTPPENLVEFVFGQPWPISWAYWMLAAVALPGIFEWKRNKRVPLAFALLPLCWFIWQLFASAHTVDASLTRATMPHLGVCVVCFYLGLFALGRIERSQSFWIGLVAGLLLVMVSGWQQHFGGLAATREYFWKEIYPTLKTIPVDYMNKISSNRIFATLFYPNTLAAAMILLLPAAGAAVYRWAGGGRFTMAARLFLTLGTLFAGLACLFWSGSKGGWLVMLFMIVLGFLTWPLRQPGNVDARTARLFRLASKVRLAVLVLLVAGGLAGFFWTYASFFKRGAPSVGARFDYWRGAVKTAIANPIHGSGPGTFAISYSTVKASESEMSRLVHNDYLQQASDSGFPGFLLYAAFIAGGLWLAHRSTRPESMSELTTEDRLMRFSVWLGICGWAIHSFMEFNLYVPAIAWSAFALLGWLCAKAVPTAD